MFNLSHQSAVPQISIDGELIVGFNEPLLRQKLGLSSAPLTTTVAPSATTRPLPTTLPATTTPVPSPLPTTFPAGNLAPNPSFESGSMSPTGWISQRLNTDASFQWLPDSGYRGGYAIGIQASQPGNQGWPGWETEASIPIDPDKKYDFTAYYFVPDTGLLWMDIRLIDSSGKTVGWISTGTSSIVPPANTWQLKSLTLDPAALQSRFPDIARVKLGLKLSLNYDVVGLAANTVGTIFYDYVSFVPKDGSVSFVPSTTTPPTPVPATTTWPPTPTLPTTPVLLSPPYGAIMDNGRFDGRDSIIWDFDWSDVAGASQYQLYVINAASVNPVINVQTAISSYHWTNNGTIGGGNVDQNRYGWNWKVRALVNGIWSPWAQSIFSVEPVDSDPITPTTLPPPVTTYPVSPGRILLINRTNPSGYSANVTMSYGGLVAYPNGLQMPDGFQVDSGFKLTPGIYTITENIPGGWQLTANIIDSSGGSFLSGNQVTVNLAPGESVTITLINTKVG